MNIIPLISYITSIFIHTIIQNDFSILNKWEPPYTVNQKQLLDKNEYKLNKICGITKCLRYNNCFLKKITFYKYHYDVIRPIRRYADFHNFVHFIELTSVKKCLLVLKYMFYGLYYSI